MGKGELSVDLTLYVVSLFGVPVYAGDNIEDAKETADYLAILRWGHEDTFYTQGAIADDGHINYWRFPEDNREGESNLTIHIIKGWGSFFEACDDIRAVHREMNL
jgi:hypothetical protein